MSKNTPKLQATNISVLILTYRRPEKIKRLLDQFLDANILESSNIIHEIVIADDCSKDDTYSAINPTIKELESKGYSVKYISRDNNLRGDMNLYNGYRNDCCGDYVWILCDDDVLVTSPVKYFLEAIVKLNPAVAICQFAQGKDNQYGTNFEGDSRVISDNDTAIHFITKFTKTSAYVLKRDLLDIFDNEIKKYDGTLFSWIGMSILLYAKNKVQGLYIHTPLTVKGDDDYGYLRYSLRVFKKLSYVINDASSKAMELYKEEFRVQLTRERSDIEWCIRGLILHYSPHSDIRYEPEIIKNEFVYIKNSLRNLFRY